MGVMESGSRTAPGTVARFLYQLAAALEERGLVAEECRARMVWAKNLPPIHLAMNHEARR